MRKTFKPSTRFLIHIVLPLVYSCLFGALAYFDGLPRWNQFLYDVTLTTWHRPAWDQALIVAIDEPSLEALGRWPWPRRTHAALIERLTETGAKVIGLDLVFAEPDIQDPAGDLILASAIRQNKHVVLPVLNEQLRIGEPQVETLPLAPLASAAGALGHVDVDLDDDGVARSVYLKAGLGTPRWPTFALAMLQLDEPGRLPQLPGDRRPQTEVSPFAWVRDYRIMLPYAGGSGHFPRVSYIDVLTGKIPASVLRDRYVLVGATVTGLNDVIYTPIKGQHTAIPGVEFNAHVLDSLWHNKYLRPAAPTWQAIVTVVLAMLPFALYSRCPQRWAPLVILTLVIITLSASTLSLHKTGVWFGVASALLAIVLSYPLWSWFQLNYAVRFLRGELQRRHRGFGTTLTPKDSPREISDIWHIVTSLEHEAYHDALTGLPNRILLLDRLNHAVANARRQNYQLAVFFIDLDKFKTINDAFGHAVGDTLLREISERLMKIKRKQDTVARMGGDEFVMLLEGIQDTDGATTVAGKILLVLGQPAHCDDHEIIPSASIGISLHPRDGNDAATLIKNADTAMYRAKIRGGNTFQFYDQEMNVRARNRLVLEKDLRRAIEEHEFVLHYQPQFQLKNRLITGFEALLRWNHPDHGMIMPDKFIHVAEDTGLIVPIGSWVIQSVTTQIATWKKYLGLEVHIAVNLSPQQFQQGNIAQQVQRALVESGIPGKLLGLEITEGTIMKSIDSAIETMKALKALDVELSIDDFGTGYSSLNYIKNFPIDQIKIDRSFINDITTNHGNSAVARTIIAMAHSLKQYVVAEGVETNQQANFLRRHRCDRVQGFYFGYPLSKEETTILLQEQAGIGLVL